MLAGWVPGTEGSSTGRVAGTGRLNAASSAAGSRLPDVIPGSPD
jgi:hypothetical protein